MNAGTSSCCSVKDAPQVWLTGALSLICALFLVSIFKNISYPLFWADEGMTVMHAERVLAYGYPKVHDGRNVVYDLRHPDPTLGIDERTDAYIGGANWGQYYFAAPWIMLAELTDDLYRKTAVIRIPFAMAGLAGLVLLGCLGSAFFTAGKARSVFLAAFASLELLSAPLVLHLREARYYPLALFLLALAIVIYVRCRVLERTGFAAYLASFTAVLILLYGTFSPAYFIFLVAAGFNEALLAAESFRQDVVRGTLRSTLRNAAPLILSLVLVAPLAAFFRASHIARELLEVNSPAGGMRLYLDNLAMEWDYFAWSDLLLPALLVKAAVPACRLYASSAVAGAPDHAVARCSRFLTILFLVYFFSIAMIPNALFTRYFIALQPVLALVLLLDASMLHGMLARISPSPRPAGAALAALFAGCLLFTLAANGGDLLGHVRELTHRFRGPLDHVIPFIREKHHDARNLVVATNYEEASFMYYLGAKVVVGFVGNNLAEDSRTVPDIIVYRKGWGNFGEVFNGFLGRARYRRVSFPVMDYPVNNIPELNWRPPFRHRFASEDEVDEPDRLELFLKEPNGAGGGRS